MSLSKRRTPAGSSDNDGHISEHGLLSIYVVSGLVLQYIFSLL